MSILEQFKRGKEIKQTSLRIEKGLYDDFVVVINEYGLGFNEAVVKLIEAEVMGFKKKKEEEEKAKPKRTKRGRPKKSTKEDTNK